MKILFFVHAVSFQVGRCYCKGSGDAEYDLTPVAGLEMVSRHWGYAVSINPIAE